MILLEIITSKKTVIVVKNLCAVEYYHIMNINNII